MLTIPNEPLRAMTNDGPLELWAVDYHPLEPSAYCWDPGWTCVTVDDIEFFVNRAGDVFRQPENESVGTVAVLRAHADAMEMELAGL
jgi:hypothetical protein